MATPGAYRIWTADANGAPLDYPKSEAEAAVKFPDPKNEAALDIYFGPVSKAPPPRDQIELQTELDKMLAVLRRLYVNVPQPQEPKFRAYYVRLFQIAQLGLEGAEVATELARSALTALTAELIDDEAMRVKNSHLSRLGGVAVKYGALFLSAYCVLRLLPEPLANLLRVRLVVEPALAANFMLLWVGCFLGVWLSYAIRTAVFTLSDLTRTDNDRLLPHMRLLFAGALTMLLGVMFVTKVVELKVGGVSLTDIGNQPLLALLVGAFCGLGEATLPTAITRKATAFVGEIK